MSGCLPGGHAKCSMCQTDKLCEFDVEKAHQFSRPLEMGVGRDDMPAIQMELSGATAAAE